MTSRAQHSAAAYRIQAVSTGQGGSPANCRGAIAISAAASLNTDPHRGKDRS